MRQTTTRALAAVTLGAAVGITTAAGLLSGIPAAADTEASSAYGVAAQGSDPVSPQPTVSSSGAVHSNSAATVSSKGGTFTSSGLKVQAGAGLATASVDNTVVAGKSIGAVSVQCRDGNASANRSGTQRLDRDLTVTYGVVQGNHAIGAVVTITSSGGNAETIDVAEATCGHGTPPGQTPPPGHKTPSPVSPRGGGSGGGTQTPAPTQPREPGHVAVTG